MTKYSKFNVVYLLQKWLDSVPGQTFMNYAYSWGASVVILGALFKLTHLPGANLMLFLGMGTEVFVFFIAGFDRPFDKTEDGKDLPTHVDAGIVLGGAQGTVDIEGAELPEGIGEGEGTAEGAVYAGTGGPTIIGGGGVVGGGGVIGGGVVGGGVIDGGGTVGGSGIIGGTGGTVIIGGGAGAPGADVEAGEDAEPGIGGTTAIDTEAIANVATSVAHMSGGVSMPELPKMNPELEDATNNYVDELKNLTEMLHKVAEQSERLSRDSEEMENLNRTLTGICKIYEMQLKGASQQIGTIDQINDQTRKMADQIAELNRIYARMIEAMTVNMPKMPSSGEQ